MPKISVIVPVYKVEPYLSRCVDSILGQSFTDFELILVDDGSPDRCPSMCDEYAQKDSRVHVIHQKNGGLSAARNAGIDWVFANSNSEWITFVDSDDWIHHQMLEYLLHGVQKNHLKISACGYRKTSTYMEDPFLNFELFNVIDVPEFYTSQSCLATIACAKLYHKALFQKIRYPINRLHEDEFVTYKVLFTQDRIAITSHPMYYYYCNSEGITGSSWTPRRLEVLEALDEQLRFFTKRQMFNVVSARIRDYLVVLTAQMDQVKMSVRLSDKNKKKYIRIIRRKMRWVFKNYKTHNPISIKNDAWLYEAAFPNEMKAFWIAKAVLGKLRLEK